MRVRLSKLDDKTTRIFIGTMGGIRYQRQLVLNVSMLSLNGESIETYIAQHVLVAKSPFKSLQSGDKVRFTGKVKKYQRADGSCDYGIIVNKAKRIG